MIPQERDLGFLLRLQNRDESALASLYDAYAPLLYGVALKILGNSADAEDVVQDALLQVWRQANSYDSRRGTVAAWLLTMLRSRALDRLRSLSSRRRAEEAAGQEIDPVVRADNPQVASVQTQLRSRLVDAFGALPPEQRQVLELAYFGGLSQSEIAAQLERPLGTVKSWSRQGLMRLRELVPREHWA